METKPNNLLETEPLGRLMLRYSLPCTVSLLVGALYNIVDQIFIANAGYLGSYGNAANTVVFPLTVIALAVAVLIGDGCCAFVSLCLGEGRSEDAHRSVGTAVVLCAASGLILAAVYLVFQEPLLAMFGGHVNGETFALSREYFFYITLGVPFYMFGQAANPIIRADGSPRFAMASTLAGAAANTVLDPLFIYVFKWGMMGAAVATVIGQVLTAVLSVWYLCRMKTVALSRDSFVPSARLAARFLPLGMTSLLSQISLVAAMAAINNMLGKYGALDPVFGQEQYAHIPMAVVGIVMKVFQIVISVAVGLAAGCIPVAGYNIGAARRDRARSLFTRLLLSEAAVGAAAMAVAELAPGSLVALFGAENESAYYTEFAVKSFRVFLSTSVLACVNKGTFIFLQSIGKAAASTLLSLLREVVFGVGLALSLPLFSGIDGVLLSMPVSDVLTALFAACIIRRTYRELNSNAPERALTRPAPFSV